MRSSWAEAGNVNVGVGSVVEEEVVICTKGVCQSVLDALSELEVLTSGCVTCRESRVAWVCLEGCSAKDALGGGDLTIRTSAR